MEIYNILKQDIMRRFIYILLGSILLLAGCKKSDWFDVKSDIKSTVPSTLQDFEYLLDEFVLMSQGSPALAEVGSDGHSGKDASITAPVEINAYTWTNNRPNLIVTDWNMTYRRIFKCNLVLDGLKKIVPSNSNDLEQYNRIKGNALFHRSKNYYDLAQIWGQPYKALSAGSDLGIPLKDGIDITEPSKRASVKETYERITTDLTMAAALLPNLAQTSTRGSKTAAFALLARTYLVMGEYEKAKEFADISLSLYNKLIDFNTVSPTAANLGLFNAETIFYMQNSSEYFSTWLSGSSFVDPNIYALYEKDDLRKTRFFTVHATNGTIFFKGTYSDNQVRFDGLATDEQYLIKAECYARTGNTLVAIKALNDLRRTRWDKNVIYPELTATNSEDALKLILLERKKELLFRNLRWSDLRRLNLDPRFKITLTRTLSGVTYTLEPDSYRYTLPIPDDVMNLAPQMKQSPGWQ